jgi:hypothetical protein
MKQADAARAAQMKIDYEAFCLRETDRFIAETIPQDEFQTLLDTHRRQNRTLLQHLSEAELTEITLATARSEIRHSGRCHFPTLAEFEHQAPNNVDS